MHLLGEFIRIQKENLLTNIAMLTNSWNVFCRVPKEVCEKVLTFLSPSGLCCFFFLYIFSYFSQCFLFPSNLIILFISLPCETNGFRCPPRCLNGNYSNSHHVELVVSSWHILFTFFSFVIGSSYHTELLPNTVLKTKEAVAGLHKTLTAKLNGVVTLIASTCKG